MATKKTAEILLQFGKVEVNVSDLQKKVKAVAGCAKAYVNVREGKVYCVDANGEPISTIDLCAEA